MASSDRFMTVSNCSYPAKQREFNQFDNYFQEQPPPTNRSSIPPSFGFVQPTTTFPPGSPSRYTIYLTVVNVIGVIVSSGFAVGISLNRIETKSSSSILSVSGGINSLTR